MSKRTPNPFNERAALVADALRWAHEQGRIGDLATAKHAELRAVLKELGLYSSEGSFRRDIAAIRKTLPEFGGPRGRGGDRQTLDFGDGYRVRALRVEDLTPALLARVVGVGSGSLDRLSVRWFDPAYFAGLSPAEARGRLLALAPRPRLVTSGGGGGGGRRDGSDICRIASPECQVFPAPVCAACAAWLAEFDETQRDDIYEDLDLKEDEIEEIEEIVASERDSDGWGGNAWILVR